MQYIAFDSHKRYTLARVEDDRGEKVDERRVEHERGALREYLSRLEPGSPVAVETIGNWYWIVDEIEEAGMQPQLVHARKAKLMMAMVNKSDRLDCQGLNRLQRTGTVPTVWIPPIQLRRLRELTRMRSVLVQERTRMKNRIHAELSKYGVRIDGVSDLFGKRGSELLEQAVPLLPEEAQQVVRTMIEHVRRGNEEIAEYERWIKEHIGESKELKLLQTIPGVGFVLAVVILLEVGDVSRFSRPEKLAAYAGTTPRIYQSGQTRRYGQVRTDVNRTLKHAFVEAANAVCIHQNHPRYQHVGTLYRRINNRKGYQKAIGAVARHLAEATYYILSKKEEYRPPKSNTVMSTHG